MPAGKNITNTAGHKGRCRSQQSAAKQEGWPVAATLGRQVSQHLRCRWSCGITSACRVVNENKRRAPNDKMPSNTTGSATFFVSRQHSRRIEGRADYAARPPRTDIRSVSLIRPPPAPFFATPFLTASFRHDAAATTMSAVQP